MYQLQDVEMVSDKLDRPVYINIMEPLGDKHIVQLSTQNIAKGDKHIHLTKCQPSFHLFSGEL